MNFNWFVWFPVQQIVGEIVDSVQAFRAVLPVAVDCDIDHYGDSTRSDHLHPDHRHLLSGRRCNHLRGPSQTDGPGADGLHRRPTFPALASRQVQIDRSKNGIVTCKSLKLLQIFTNGNAGRVESVASAQQPPRCRSCDSFDEVTRRAIVSKTAEPGEKWPMVFRHDNNSYPDSCDCRQRDQPGIDPHFHRRLHPKLFDHITPLLIVHIIIYGWHWTIQTPANQRPDLNEAVEDINLVGWPRLWPNVRPSPPTWI